jgi:hypothetical protein
MKPIEDAVRDYIKDNIKSKVERVAPIGGMRIPHIITFLNKSIALAPTSEDVYHISLFVKALAELREVGIELELENRTRRIADIGEHIRRIQAGTSKSREILRLERAGNLTEFMTTCVMAAWVIYVVSMILLTIYGAYG